MYWVFHIAQKELEFHVFWKADLSPLKQLQSKDPTKVAQFMKSRAVITSWVSQLDPLGLLVDKAASLLHTYVPFDYRFAILEAKFNLPKRNYCAKLA